MSAIFILIDVFALHSTRGLKCDGCNLGKEYYSNGYHCFRTGFFFHEECAASAREINNLYHPQHSLHIKVVSEPGYVHGECKLCRGSLPKMYYYCSICDFAIDLICARKEVTITIDGPNTHEHRLSLVPKMIKFTCHLCGILDDRFPYVCNLCELSFHKDCAESIPEINYSCHPKHPLQRLTSVLKYSGGKCCLCGNKLCDVFYHCSVCNFSVDVNCAKNPPPFTLVNLKAHEHQLTLLPQRTVVCNACGMVDDPNLYVCVQCNFMIHRNCIDIPRVIKINRHQHRLYYKHFLNAGDWECRLCHQEIIWTCGAYSCLECSEFAIHVRCATRVGIWDGTDLEGISETNIEVKSYEVIEDGVIKHFSHEEHVLKLKEKSDANDECIYCEACASPVFSGPFYSCMECHNFILHQKCAYLPKQKIDPFYKTPITLSPVEKGFQGNLKYCNGCQYFSQGFKYTNNINIVLDVRCASISEPFFHESHPHHPLYIDSMGNGFCKACGDKATIILSCEECRFVLDLKCSILPKRVKHKYDKHHLLFLSYGEDTSDQYWCEICEEELNPQKWFYTCDDCGFTFHIKCTLGDVIWTNPKYHVDSMVKLNNRMTRLVCEACHSHCDFPYYLQSSTSKSTFCSVQCFHVYRFSKKSQK